MYLTHSFVAITKGNLDYLLFYITEDYIEEQEHLRKKLNPILERFARDLKDKGALVKAFDKDIRDANKELEDRFDLDLLQSYADREDRSSGQAQSLLRLNGVKESISAYLPSADEKRLSFINVSSMRDFDSKMEIFPNPAEEYFTLSYELIPESTSPITMTMVDVQGKVVKSQTLSRSQDQVLIPTEGIQSGNYLLTISQDGRIVGSESLSILENQ